MSALADHILSMRDEIAKWRYKALKLGLYASRLHGLAMAEDPEYPRPAGRAKPSELEAAALALYAPPFRHDHGFIFDKDGLMVADQSGHVLRVRGWGRISYHGADAEKLQDTVGVHVARALTEYWTKEKP